MGAHVPNFTPRTHSTSARHRTTAESSAYRTRGGHSPCRSLMRLSRAQAVPSSRLPDRLRSADTGGQRTDRPPPSSSQPTPLRPMTRSGLTRAALGYTVLSEKAVTTVVPACATGDNTPGRPAGAPGNMKCLVRLSPALFSQLPTMLHSLWKGPPNPPPTSGKRDRASVWTACVRHHGARRTSQGRRRVERFVIEWFTPSCHVDIAVGGELVTPTIPEAVDSILVRGSRIGRGDLDTAGEAVQDREDND